MKALCGMMLLVSMLCLASCETVLWSFVQVDAGRDRKDPNEVVGVSVGVPVVPLEARLSLETKERD